jgi:hypothetical protein
MELMQLAVNAKYRCHRLRNLEMSLLRQGVRGTADQAGAFQKAQAWSAVLKERNMTRASV